jgi:hypothetical protein
LLLLPKKEKKSKMKIISSCLVFCLAIELGFGLPFRKSDSGVKLQGREKVHGEGEKCPTGLNYCKCKSKGSSLDITCEDINTSQLKVNILKARTNFFRSKKQVKNMLNWSPHLDKKCSFATNYILAK